MVCPMNRWTRFTTEHPKIILAFVAAAALLACLGLHGLRFDASSGSMARGMTGADRCLSGETWDFGDASNAFIVAVESVHGVDLFSRAVFSPLGQLVAELEEFREFNPGVEDRRLEHLCRSGNVSAQASAAGKTAAPGGDGLIVRSSRERRAYQYRFYKPVPIAALGSGMDEGGFRQLRSVLAYNGMDSIRADHRLTRDEFRKILETWETLYLFKSRGMLASLSDPLSALSMTGERGSISARALVPMDDGRRELPPGRDPFAAYKKMLFSNPAFESFIYSKKDDHAEALGINGEIRNENGADALFDYFRAVIDKYNRPPLVLTAAGAPENRRLTGIYALGELRVIMPLCLLAMTAVIFAATGTLMPSLFCGLSIVLALLWTAGLLGHLGVPITPAGIMAFPLIVAMTGLWSARYAGAFASGRAWMREVGFKYGLAGSLAGVFRTAVFSAIAIAAASAALLSSPAGPVGGFGLLALMGTVCAFAASAIFMPAALAAAGRGLAAASGDAGMPGPGYMDAAAKKLTGLFAKAAGARPGAVTLVSLAAAGIFSLAVTRGDYSTTPFFFCSEDSAPRESAMRVAVLFGGTSHLNVAVDSGRAGGALDPSFLDAVDDTARGMNGSPGASAAIHTYSFADAVRGMHMAVNRGDPDSYEIPRNESAIKDYYSAYSGRDGDSDGLPDIFEGLVDAELRRVNIRARVPASAAGIFSRHGALQQADTPVTPRGSHESGRRYERRSSGEAVDYCVVSAGAAGAWWRGAFFAVLCASVSMLILFKKWRVCPAVFGSLSAVLVSAFGAAVIFGVQLTFPVLTVVCAAVAVGLDCTTGLLLAAGSNVSGGMGLRESLIEAQAETFGRMFPGLAAVFAGSFLFTFSGYAPFSVMGWMFCLICLCSVWAVFILLPAVGILYSVISGRKALQA